MSASPLVPAWIQVLEAAPGELRAVLGGLNPSEAPAIYGEGLRLYLDGETAALRSLIDRVGAELPTVWSELLEFRFELRSGSARPERLDWIRGLEAQGDAPPFAKAEAWFLGGTLALALQDHQRCQECYGQSAKHFEALKCPRKSVRAHHNAISAEARLHPERKLIADYLRISERARAVGEDGIAGFSLHNVSRYYQLLGATDAAKKYSRQSIELLKGEEGSASWWQAIAHRAHLAFELGQDEEFRSDLELCAASGHAEIQAIVKFLEVLTRSDGPNPNELSAELQGSWMRRQKFVAKVKHEGHRPPVPLTESENDLVLLLAPGPMDRSEVMSRLYGTRLDPLSADQRLRTLVSRLNRKRKGFVRLERGVLSLGESARKSGELDVVPVQAKTKSTRRAG